MASTKLRDISNDHLKPIVMVSNVTPPPPSVTDSASSKIVENTHNTKLVNDPYTEKLNEALHQPIEKKNSLAIPVAIFAGIVIVGSCGLFIVNKNQQTQDYYTHDSLPNEAALEVVAAASEATLAADAAVESAEDGLEIPQEEIPSDAIEAPLLTLGSSWNYKVIDYAKPENSYDNVRLSVNEVNNDGYLFYKEWIGTDKESAFLNYDQGLNLRGGAIASYSPSLAYYDFPLYEGKTWERGSDVLNHKYKSSDYVAIEGKVVGWETISSPNWSNVNALRVEVIVNTYKEGVRVGRELDVSWYEPKVGRSIKTLDYKWNPETESFGQPTRMHYLTNYDVR